MVRSQSKSEAGEDGLGYFRKLEIARAALRLFSAKGYGTTTLDAVAKEAGVTKGSVYHHFTDKKEVLEFSIAASLPPSHDGTGPVDGSAKERLAAALEDAWRRWTDPGFGRFYRLMMGEIASTHPDLFERWFKAGPLRTWDAWKALIQEGKRKKEFRKGVDATDMSRLMLASLSNLAIFQNLVPKRHPEYCPRERVFAFTKATLLEALERPKAKG